MNRHCYRQQLNTGSTHEAFWGNLAPSHGTPLWYNDTLHNEIICWQEQREKKPFDKHWNKFQWSYSFREQGHGSEVHKGVSMYSKWAINIIIMFCAKGWKCFYSSNSCFCPANFGYFNKIYLSNIYHTLSNAISWCLILQSWQHELRSTNVQSMSKEYQSVDFHYTELGWL